MSTPGIKIFAPATVGNVACGFDVLGLAIEGLGDELIARRVDEPGLRIVKITGAKGKLPYEVEKNTAGLAGLRLLQQLGKEQEIGIEFELRKKMPFGSGLGSSAASAVAGAMAVNELLKRPFEKRDLLPFALAGESVATGTAAHADNVAPALLGGIILVRSSNPPDVHRLPAIPGLQITIISPKLEVMTKEARSILSSQVALSDFVQQSANLGAFVAAMYRQDIELLGRCLRDVIIEPQRAKLIPHFYEVQAAALEAGALGCSISGAGPAIFALSPNSLIAEAVGFAMCSVWDKYGIEHTIYRSPINLEGARKM
ncbi:MAG TPA: homoserine kinase [Phaeodactylibacter sp.]|nr:homoserine kinase [Phaeodactylibacter sp.]